MSADQAIGGPRRPPFSIKSFLYPLLTRPGVKQAIKWFVYSALLVNAGYYLYIDYVSWLAAIPDDASLTDSLTHVSTSIDTIAWILLVILFELETYALPDKFWTKWLLRSIHLLRFTCYVLIAYAAWGYTVEMLGTYHYRPAVDVTGACDVANEGVSMQLDANTWIEITADNCATLTDDTSFVRFDGEIALIPESVLPHLQVMGWFDVINAVFWIIVVLLIEAEVRMQNADRFGGQFMMVVQKTKMLLYAVLIGNCFVWLFTGYYVWSWDAFLWIFGFWAIELNLAEWELLRTTELESLHPEPD